MPDFLAFLLRLLGSPYCSNLELEIELLALRQQLAIYQRSIPRPRLRLRDRLFWCRLSRVWSRWKEAIVIVKPSTVIAWRRREFWTTLSSKRGPGRPPVPQEIQELIRRMSEANVTWGSPRIASWDTAPRYMIRDRDSIYGDVFRGRVKAMGIKEVLIAPRSPWQSPFVERLIGSVRRDVLDHVVVINQRHLHRVLKSYFAYYHGVRCHMALDGDAPGHRDVQPPEMGKVIAIPEVGGLHHRYLRRVA